MRIFYSILICILFATCIKPAADKRIYSVYKPVLMDAGKVNTDLFILPARENKNITIIHTSGNRLYCLDYGLGIHIIDISNIDKPEKLGFYQIPACIDFEVKGDTIYANNFRDFIMLDFKDATNPVFLKRVSSLFDIQVKSPDGISVFNGLATLPKNTIIISYEKI